MKGLQAAEPKSGQQHPSEYVETVKIIPNQGDSAGEATVPEAASFGD
jgi:hypothetical protein